MTGYLRAYRALIALLPRSVRLHDGDEMLRTLEEQLAHAPNRRAVAWRAFLRFPKVLALEWRDVLVSGGIPAPLPVSRGSHMDAVTRMLKQSGRSLVRTPVFSLSVVLLLGVGVGSVTAIFTVVDHVLLRGLPYPAAERLVGIGDGVHSMPAMRDFEAMQSIETWAGAATDEANLTGAGDPLRVRQAIVTDGFFPMFGARAAIGRLLQPADSRGAATAVLSYGMWVRVFGGDTSVVGRTIRINDAPMTVVGVVDGRFALPEALVGTSVDVWSPPDPSEDYMTNRDYWMFRVAGRLREAATIEQARQEAKGVASARAREFPTKYTNSRGIIELPVRTFDEMTTGGVERPLKVFLGAVTLLLLVAGANVTHLILARGVARVREMALRRALGARTRSLIAQLLVESGLLGVTGGLVGVAIAYVGVRAFLILAPAGLPRAATIGVDARVLLFAAGVGLITAIVFGLVPALPLARGSGGPLRESGRSVTSGRSAQRLRNALVVGEVALSLVLVVQAGWLLRSFIRMQHEELGFRTTGIVTMPMSIPVARRAGAGSDAPDPAVWYQRVDAVRESLARTPGVQGVTFGLTMPLEWVGGVQCCWSTRPDFPGRDSPERPSATHHVTEDFFAIFAIRMLAGEAWSHSATMESPAPAVVSAQLARQVFGDAAAAVGGAFTLDQKQYRIVGVAADTRHYGADQPYGTAIYIPMNTIPLVPANVTIAVRTDRTDDALAADLRAAVWQVEPSVPVPTIRSIAEAARRDTAHRQFDAMLFGTFSVIALLLVAGGLAGTLLYMVSQQRRSLGIRLALGATPRALERSVLTSGIALAAAGVLLGALGAWFSGKLIEARLFGAEARDMQTLAIAVSVLMVVALAASWIPARRAALTNPMESLRSD
ncbi:MAG TPA: ADOP family duplicated permease [Gemmatimonadaceae bacterium]|nr:ADOP family duplicated permease [Gemmatimonadaceae bacterium]